MKTLEKTQYTCPECKSVTEYQEWTEDHSPKELLCTLCEPYELPNIITKQSWVSVSERLMPDPRKMDAKAEIRATDAMLEEREKEVRSSAKARSWEESRKREFKQNIPAMKKAEAAEKEHKIDKIFREVTKKY